MTCISIFQGTPREATPSQGKLKGYRLDVVNYHLKVNRNLRIHHVQGEINEVLRLLVTLDHHLWVRDFLQHRLRMSLLS